MTRVVYGERIGRQGKIQLGCSATLFDPSRERILLTRRLDNGTWCLPGGRIDPGESVAEGCAREVFEETGLVVKVSRLTGVYSDPNQVVIYPDENINQIISLNFEVILVGGEMGLSNETTDIRFFPTSEATKMDLFHSHGLRISDALSQQAAAYIR